MKNLQNERSRFAFDQVSEIKKKHKDIASEFKSLARSTPAKIQVTGLGTVIAFLYSRKGKSGAHSNMYELISCWLQQQDLPPRNENCHTNSKNADDALMDAITKSGEQTYRLMTNEVQQLLIWVKRFSEGMIDSEEI